MKGYIIIVDSEVIDAGSLAGLASQLLQEVEAHGGRYLVRGGPITLYGGDLAPARAAVVEFDSPEQAKALLESPRFSELRKLRSQFVKTSAFVVEGV